MLESFNLEGGNPEEKNANYSLVKQGGDINDAHCKMLSLIQPLI